MERNNLVLFKPTASFCFGEKVLSSRTRILFPSMSDGGEGCFYHLGGWRVCGTKQLSLGRKGETTLGVQLHTGIGKSWSRGGW